MITFVIGTKEYDAGPVPIARLKKLWPLIKDQVHRKIDGSMTMEQMVENGFEALTKTCHILSVLLVPSYPELTPDFVEEHLLPSEVDAAAKKIQVVLIEAGLLQGGPLMPSVAPPSHSTATSTPSSASSSPTVAKEEAGIE